LELSSLEKRERTSVRVSPVFFQANEARAAGEATTIFFLVEVFFQPALVPLFPTVERTGFLSWVKAREGRWQGRTMARLVREALLPLRE